MKKYIYITILGIILITSNTTKNIKANDVKTNKIEQTKESFIIKGTKYSIIDNNNVTLESFSALSEKDIKLEDKIKYKNKVYKVIEIKENAFKGLSKIETITINDSLEKIEKNPFINLPNLKEIKTTENTINFNSEKGVLYDKIKKELVAYPLNKKEKSYTILSGIEKIGENAFKNNTNIEEVTLTSFTKEIGKGAFENTENLKEIKNGVTLKKIDSQAFKNSGLKNINLSNILEYLGTNVFEGTKIESFNLSTKITKIPDNTFNNAKELKNIKIHSNVTEIGDYAFTNTSIKSISPFISVEKIGIESFKNTKLETIEDANNLKIIRNKAFKGSPLYALENINNLESIGEEVFTNTNIKKIILPEKFKELSPTTFLDAKYLEEIEVSELNEKYESFNNALYTKGKKKLVLIPSNYQKDYFIIPNELEEISLIAIFNNPKIKRFQVLKDNKKYIEQDGVLYTKDKKTLVKFPSGKETGTFEIPDEVENIKSLAFENAKNITDTVYLGINIKEIADNAFYNSSITSFFANKENPYYSTYNGAIYNNDLTKLIKFPPNSKTKEYELPESVKIIGKQAFANTNIKNIKINSNLIEIEEESFKNSSLENIHLNYNFKKIGKNSFENSKIKSIILPITLETIEQNAFKDCKELTKIEFEGMEIKNLGENILENTPELNNIKVPKNKKEKFLNIFKNQEYNKKIVTEN